MAKLIFKFEEKFSDVFIAEVRESEEAYVRGGYIEVKNILGRKGKTI